MFTQLLNPIVEKNRDEVFLIQFFGLFKNFSELYYRGIQNAIKNNTITLNEALAILPMLNGFVSDNSLIESGDETSNTFKYIPARHAHIALLGNRKVDDNDIEFMISILKNITYEDIKSSSQFLTELLVSRLSKEGFVKKIYLFDNVHSDLLIDFRDRYVEDTYLPETLNKLSGIRYTEMDKFPNRLCNTLIENEDITTVILDESYAIRELIDELTKLNRLDILDKKYFMISADSNLKLSKENNGFEYIDLDFHSECYKKYGCVIEYFNNFIIDKTKKESI